MEVDATAGLHDGTYSTSELTIDEDIESQSRIHLALKLPGSWILSSHGKGVTYSHNSSVQYDWS